MAAYTRVRRLVNPRRVVHKVKRRTTKAPKAHRRRTPPRNPDGSFRKRKKARRPVVPKTRKRTVRVTNRKCSVKRNPAYLLTFGSAAANPRRRRKTTVKTNRKRKTVNRRPRRSNPTRVVVVAPKSNRRRSNKRHYTVRHKRHNRRRNPQILGTNLSTPKLLEFGLGIVAGVWGTKAGVGYMPASLVGIGGSWGKVFASGLIAFGVGMLRGKFPMGAFGDGVFAGAIGQTASVGLNAVSPSLGAQFGLGELVAGGFPVPMNPVLAGRNALQVAAPATRVTTSGLARAYPAAY